MSRWRNALFSLVRRPGAEDHLLLSLLAFALSVSLTRLFLWLAGYPQLGGESLHISHVLWGGLFLFVAALLPLIFANQQVYRLTAILSGLGVGLFIDEVGKFITQSYDYFYPLAAPIIYAFFLACVLVYLQVGRPRSRQARLELYAALEYLEQVLERDLDAFERRLLTDHLETAANAGEEPELAQLASVLLDFVRSDWITEVPPSGDPLGDLRQKIGAWQSRLLARPAAWRGVVIGLVLLGSACLVAAAWLLILNFQTLVFAVSGFPRLISGAGYSWWIFSMALFFGVTGVGLALGASWIWLGGPPEKSQAPILPSKASRFTRGLRWSFAALVLQLTVLDLLLFYYLQFSAILLVVIQLALLQAVIHYQRDSQPLA